MIIKAALRQKLFYVCCRTFCATISNLLRSYPFTNNRFKMQLKNSCQNFCVRGTFLVRLGRPNESDLLFLKFGVTGVKIPHCESVKLYWCSYVHKWCEKFLLETAEDMIIYDIYYTKITFGLVRRSSSGASIRITFVRLHFRYSLSSVQKCFTLNFEGRVLGKRPK